MLPPQPLKRQSGPSPKEFPGEHRTEMSIFRRSLAFLKEREGQILGSLKPSMF